MEVQSNQIFSSGSTYEQTYYTPYHTPPYIGTYQQHWLGPEPPLAVDNNANQIQQMQHIRFPTPPITPPRYALCGTGGDDPQSASAANRRTQTVIMKVGPDDRSAQAVRADLYALKEQKLSDSSDSVATSPSADFVCSWLHCGRYFDTLEALAQHVTQKHAIASLHDGLYYCRWQGCQRSERGFNARYKMLVHVRTHTKEKPHQCQLCEKSFSRAENLKIHIRSHSGEKPYKCTFEGCQKAYSNSSDRFKHTRTHSMEKPYMCKVPGCQKRYTDPSSLRKHVKTFKHGLQLISTAAATVGTSHEAATQNERATHTATRMANEAYYQHCLLETSAQTMCCTPAGYGAALHNHDNCKPLAPNDYAQLLWSEPHEISGTSVYLPALVAQLDIAAEAPLDLRVNKS